LLRLLLLGAVLVCAVGARAEVSELANDFRMNEHALVFAVLAFREEFASLSWVEELAGLFREVAFRPVFAFDLLFGQQAQISAL